MKAVCPICGAEVQFNERYPKAVCGQCMKLITDAAGRRVAFYNIDMSGGLTGQYPDTRQVYASDICYITGRPCRAQEAHMGGIVIIPIDADEN